MTTSMDVGIRELKEHLSDYVERASRGELIRITLRGRPVATLGPLPGVDRLREGIAEGWVTPGVDEPPVPVTRVAATTTIADVLEEDRGR